MLHEIKEFDLKYVNRCNTCCMHCISYATKECADCCDTIGADCNSCLLKSKVRQTHKESIDEMLY